MTKAAYRDNRPDVTRLRHHILAHRRWAATLIALALLMKLLVPAGFMPTASAGMVTIELCTGAGAQTMTIPGGNDHDKQGGHGKAESPCVFAGLGAPSLAAADPILVAIAIAFIIATVFRLAVAPTALSVAHLRPPLRGPPAAI